MASSKKSSDLLVEATCEVHFKRQEPWDLVNFGLFYPSIKDRYPKVSSYNRVELDVEFEAQFSEVTTDIKQDLLAGFADEAEETFVYVGDGLLVFKKIAYQGWVEFRSNLGALLDAFSRIFPIETYEVIRLGYVNASAYKDLAKLEQNFKLIPKLFKTGNEQPLTIRQEAAYPVDHNGVQRGVNFTISKELEEQLPVQLLWEVYCLGTSIKPDVQVLESTLDNYHQKVWETLLDVTAKELNQLLHQLNQGFIKEEGSQ